MELLGYLSGNFVENLVLHLLQHMAQIEVGMSCFVKRCYLCLFCPFESDESLFIKFDYRKWGFEKLVYKDVKKGIRRDRKYAVQPRNVFATGVHMSQNTGGKTTHKTEGRIMYYHYHGTIAERREPCRQMVNTTDITIDGTPYSLDTSMRNAAGFVKRFELKMIGSTLQKTRQ